MSRLIETFYFVNLVSSKRDIYELADKHDKYSK